MNQEPGIKKAWNKISDKVRHIQSQPESVKIRYIWILAIAIFIAIVAIWLIFFKIVPAKVGTGSGASAPISGVKNDLKEKIKSGFGELKNNALPELKEMLKDEGKANETQITPSPSNTVDENLK